MNGTCINLAAFWYANAAANMIGDFVILALPVPVVKNLKLPQRQKLGLLLVFALGGLYEAHSGSSMVVLTALSVCITSILRMTTLKMGSEVSRLAITARSVYCHPSDLQARARRTLLGAIGPSLSRCLYDFRGNMELISCGTTGHRHFIRRS